MPIGSAWSLTAHSSWKISSARLRVLQKTRVVVLLDQLHHLAGGVAARMARPGNAAFGMRIDRSGSAPGSPSTRLDRVDVGVGRQPAAIGVGIGDGGAEADAAKAGDSACRRDSDEGQQVAALFAGEGVDFVDHDVLRFSNSSALSG